MDINTYLKDGERLLWKGKAVSTQKLNKTYKKKFMKDLIIIVCVLAVLLVLCLMMAKHQNVSMNWVFFGLVVLLACIPLINISSDAGRVASAVYAATDRRLIVVTDGAKSIEYGRIKEAAMRTDDDKLTTLLCGSRAVKSKPGSWRDLTCRGNQATKAEDDAKAPCESFAFYAVNDPEGLRSVLKDRLSCPIK